MEVIVEPVAVFFENSFDLEGFRVEGKGFLAVRSVRARVRDRQGIRQLVGGQDIPVTVVDIASGSPECLGLLELESVFLDVLLSVYDLQTEGFADQRAEQQRQHQCQYKDA